MAMTDPHKKEPARQYPEIYEKWLPIAIKVLAAIVVVVLFFAIIVALGLI